MALNGNKIYDENKIQLEFNATPIMDPSREAKKGSIENSSPQVPFKANENYRQGFNLTNISLSLDQELAGL